MAGRDVSEQLRHDVLIDIPLGDRRFRPGGIMLLPSRATVEAALKKVQRGATLTMTELRQRIGKQHGANTACPFMTKRALMAIAEDSAATAPWWRITKPGGAMMTYFPGGPAGQARRLKAEGV